MLLCRVVTIPQSEIPSTVLAGGQILNKPLLANGLWASALSRLVPKDQCSRTIYGVGRSGHDCSIQTRVSERTHPDQETSIMTTLALTGTNRRPCGQLGDAGNSEVREALPPSKPPQKEHASASVGSAAPRSIATSCILATKSLRHATRRPTKLLLIVVGTTLVIGFCFFDRNIGHIAVASIFGMIAYAMIRGT